VKVRDLFHDSALFIRTYDGGWLISLRSSNGDEDVIRFYQDREDALEVVDAWMEAMGDETELDVPAFVLDEPRSLMLETLRRMAAGEMPHGQTGIDHARLEAWFREQMGE
jgi:hypothetical protein